jgi:hypothetical protein
MRRETGPLRPEKYAELRDIIAELKAEYGERLVKAEANRENKPNKTGRPETWSYIRLFTLWVVVEACAKFKAAKIDEACRFVEGMGGVFEYTGYDASSYDPSNFQHFFRAFAAKYSTIRRLYYRANKEFDSYEETYKDRFRPGLKLSLIKNRLMVHAHQFADEKANFIQLEFLSIMACVFVNGHLYIDGTLSLPDFPGFEPMTRTKVSKLVEEENVSARINSLFRLICGEDGRGADAFRGPPRLRADGCIEAKKAHSR